MSCAGDDLSQGMGLSTVSKTELRELCVKENHRFYHVIGRIGVLPARWVRHEYMLCGDSHYGTK